MAPRRNVKITGPKIKADAVSRKLPGKQKTPRVPLKVPTVITISIPTKKSSLVVPDNKRKIDANTKMDLANEVARSQILKEPVAPRLVPPPRIKPKAKITKKKTQQKLVRSVFFKNTNTVAEDIDVKPPLLGENVTQTTPPVKKRGRKKGSVDSSETGSSPLPAIPSVQPAPLSKKKRPSKKKAVVQTQTNTAKDTATCKTDNATPSTSKAPMKAPVKKCNRKNSNSHAVAKRILTRKRGADPPAQIHATKQKKSSDDNENIVIKDEPIDETLNDKNITKTFKSPAQTKRKTLSLKRKKIVAVSREPSPILQTPKLAILTERDLLGSDSSSSEANVATLPKNKENTSKTNDENLVNSRKTSTSSISNLSWTLDISSSSTTTCVTASSDVFVRFNKKLPFIQLPNIDSEVNKYKNRSVKNKTSDVCLAKNVMSVKDKTMLEEGLSQSNTQKSENVISLISSSNSENNHSEESNTNTIINKDYRQAADNLMLAINKIDMEFINWLPEASGYCIADLSKIKKKLLDILKSEFRVLSHCRKLQEISNPDAPNNAYDEETNTTNISEVHDECSSKVDTVRSPVINHKTVDNKIENSGCNKVKSSTTTKQQKDKTENNKNQDNIKNINDKIRNDFNIVKTFDNNQVNTRQEINENTFDHNNSQENVSFKSNENKMPDVKITRTINMNTFQLNRVIDKSGIGNTNTLFERNAELGKSSVTENTRQKFDSERNMFEVKKFYPENKKIESNNNIITANAKGVNVKDKMDTGINKTNDTDATHKEKEDIKKVNEQNTAKNTIIDKITQDFNKMRTIDNDIFLRSPCRLSDKKTDKSNNSSEYKTQENNTTTDKCECNINKTDRIDIDNDLTKPSTSGTQQDYFEHQPVTPTDSYESDNLSSSSTDFTKDVDIDVFAGARSTRNSHDDDDALSLFAESITGIESSRVNTSIVSAPIETKKRIEEYIPIPIQQPLQKNYTYCPTKISDQVKNGVVKTVCEKQNADSTSIYKESIKNLPITEPIDSLDSICSLESNVTVTKNHLNTQPISEYNFNSESQYDTNVNFVTSPTMQALSQRKLPDTYTARSRECNVLFKGYCLKNIANECPFLSHTCRYYHYVPDEDEIKQKLGRLTEHFFIQEYILIRTWHRLRRKYGEYFIHECAKRKLTRLLVEMSYDFIKYSFKGNIIDHQLKVLAVELCLLHLNNVDLSECEDLLKLEVECNKLLCECLMSIMTRTQNFSQFKSVFLNLTYFMVNNDRTFTLGVAERILERVCILPYDETVVRGLIQIMRLTNPHIFGNSMISKFENVLSNYSDVWDEYMLVKQSVKLVGQEDKVIRSPVPLLPNLDQAMLLKPVCKPLLIHTMEQPMMGRSVIREGVPLPPSPDTTHLDNMNKSVEETVTPRITRTVWSYNSTPNVSRSTGRNSPSSSISEENDHIQQKLWPNRPVYLHKNNRYITRQGANRFGQHSGRSFRPPNRYMRPRYSHQRLVTLGGNLKNSFPPQDSEFFET